MPQAYSNPARANDPHALPDVEYWRATIGECACGAEVPAGFEHDPMCWGPVELTKRKGWFWWPCFPGCLPDGDPVGPFATEAECIADFTQDAEDDDEGEPVICDRCGRDVQADNYILRGEEVTICTRCDAEIRKANETALTDESE